MGTSIVERYGYEAPFGPIIVLLAMVALLWFKVDAQRQVIPEHGSAGAATFR